MANINDAACGLAVTAPGATILASKVLEALDAIREYAEDLGVGFHTTLDTAFKFTTPEGEPVVLVYPDVEGGVEGGWLVAYPDAEVVPGYVPGEDLA